MKKDMVSPFAPAPTPVSSPVFSAAAPSGPTAAAIPAPPAGWTPLPQNAKKGLRRMPDQQRAEVQQALEQVDEKKATVRRDLTELAPDPAQAIALREEMDRARAVRIKAETLVAFAIEEEERANHAAMVYIDDMVTEVEHVARKRPHVALEYDKLLKITEQRSQAIVAGQTHARELKAAEKKTA